MSQPGENQGEDNGTESATADSQQHPTDADPDEQEDNGGNQQSSYLSGLSQRFLERVNQVPMSPLELADVEHVMSELDELVSNTVGIHSLVVQTIGHETLFGCIDAVEEPDPGLFLTNSAFRKSMANRISERLQSIDTASMADAVCDMLAAACERWREMNE